MSTLLAILAHPHTDDFSWSLATFDEFIKSYEEEHPDEHIIIRDLFEEKVPALDNDTFAAWKRNKYAPDTLTEADQVLLARHNAYVDEFIAADKYVFVNPMYNGFTTAELKQYIDVIAVPRKLFRYTENGPVGLLKGKKSLHIQSAGGFYHNEEDASHMAEDLGAAYIEQTMKMIGIEAREQLFVEGYAHYPERAEELKKKAFDEARELGKDF
ncbi:FMN-dependent NADH-azoreductase [Lactococcus allomyrinae]|uniref:FMN dependent NADH:quinone oxidoreductase n=1 Tax=Lactococcus allomyrinae TaxID=2419773 RepID=A0A387BBF1_9LACT|nr:FMN-dependent NADH-azoreductase [Lactococcus allomyrinae]AYF99727.1 FMN-dependent NADH-azoreductase [Lactococcus allomyrinae]